MNSIETDVDIILEMWDDGYDENVSLKQLITTLIQTRETIFEQQIKQLTEQIRRQEQTIQVMSWPGD